MEILIKLFLTQYAGNFLRDLTDRIPCYSLAGRKTIDFIWHDRPGIDSDLIFKAHIFHVTCSNYLKRRKKFLLNFHREKTASPKKDLVRHARSRQSFRTELFGLKHLIKQKDVNQWIIGEMENRQRLRSASGKKSNYAW